VESLAEIDRRKVAEVVRRSRDKKQRLCDPFFALSPKPIARFCWKRARLSLFRPQPHLPSFIQMHPSFGDLLAKMTFQIGSPIKIRLYDSKRASQRRSASKMLSTDITCRIIKHAATVHLISASYQQILPLRGLFFGPSVCMTSVTFVHPAKAVGRSKMPFDRDTREVSGNTVLDSGPVPHW